MLHSGNVSLAEAEKATILYVLMVESQTMFGDIITKPAPS